MPLSLPCKQGVPVSFSKALSAYIQNVHQLDPTEYAGPLRQLDELRMAVLSPIPSIESIHKMMEYYAQLRRLPQRFPIGGEQGQGIKLSFSWQDFAGKKKKTVSCFDLKFEQVAILFNIGAIYSQLAAGEVQSTAEGLKKACHYFSLAAGAFAETIKTSKGLDLPPGSDVLAPATTVIQEMMLAQAQECFVLKAILDKNVKDLTLAKLAASTAAMFDGALCKIEGGVRGLFVDYQDTLTAKAAYYRALAHYKRSSDFLIASQYGREIVKLQEAEENLKVAKDLVKRLPGDSLGQINALGVTIAQNLDRATKDNSIIYHNPIPARGSWGDCGSAVVVKPSPFPESSLEGALDVPFLFERLPEIHISRLVHETYQRRGELLEEYSRRLDGAFLALEELFSRLGLPGAVQALTTPEGLPEEVKRQAAELRRAGGYEGLEVGRSKVQSLKDRCLDSLRSIINMLDEEERQDMEARDKYSPRWARPMSVQLNYLLRQRSSELQKIMVDGETVDASLEQLFDKHIASIIMLCYSDEELGAAIPSSRGPSPLEYSALTTISEEITFAMTRKEEFRERRAQVYVALQQAADSFDVVHKVYESKDNPAVSSIIEGDLRATLETVDQGSIEVEIEEFCRLMERLVADFNSHLHSSAQNTEQRQTVLQSLNEAGEAFRTIMLQFDSATQFYTNVSEYIMKLHQVCEPFVTNRRNEYHFLVQMLEAQMTTPLQAAQGPVQGHYPSYGYPEGHAQPTFLTSSSPSAFAPQPGVWSPNIPIRYAPPTGPPPVMPSNVSPVGYAANPHNPYPSTQTLPAGPISSYPTTGQAPYPGVGQTPNPVYSEYAPSHYYHQNPQNLQNPQYYQNPPYPQNPPDLPPRRS